MKKKVYSTCKSKIVEISSMIMQSASGAGFNNQITEKPQLARPSWGGNCGTQKQKITKTKNKNLKNMKKLFTTVLFAACTLAASANDYYVSVEGAGNRNGTNWDNAWGVAELKEKLKKTAKSNTDPTPDFNDSDNIYFASGTYKFGQALNIIKKGINLIGATGVERTVFSGDVNNDNIASSGDLGNLVYIKTDVADDLVAEPKNTKPVKIQNIDFTLLKLEQPSDVKNGDPLGALYIQNCGSTVTVEKCNFYNIENTGHGGSAICSKFSRIVVKDCTFKNIKAFARGVVIRLYTNDSKTKGYTTIENCIFENNAATTTTTTDPCGIVMLQYGQELNVSNCVFNNNTAGGKASCIYNYTEPDATYYKRVMNVKNCYFLNNTSADNKVILKNSATTLENNYIGADKEFPSINVTSVGAATYYLGASFTMPEGLTGKTFASVKDKMLVVDKVYPAGKVVPAGTALLIVGAEGTYNPVLKETTDEAPSGNLLKGADDATQTTGGEPYYKLADGENGLGFYWGAHEGAAFESAAHKAYLCLNDGTGARKAFFFNGETTGIESLNGSSGSNGSNGSRGSRGSNGSSGVKVLKDGRLVIEKGGKTYNAVGAEVM